MPEICKCGNEPVGAPCTCQTAREKFLARIAWAEKYGHEITPADRALQRIYETTSNTPPTPPTRPWGDSARMSWDNKI